MTWHCFKIMSVKRYCPSPKSRNFNQWGDDNNAHAMIVLYPVVMRCQYIYKRGLLFIVVGGYSGTSEKQYSIVPTLFTLIIADFWETVGIKEKYNEKNGLFLSFRYVVLLRFLWRRGQ